MEQIGAQHVRGLGKAADLVEQRRAAERREGNLAKQLHRAVRPVADTEGNEGIGFRIADIIQPPRRQYVEGHVRIHLAEFRDMRAQEQRREARRAGNGKGATDAGAGVAGHGIAQHRQRLAHVAGIALAARRQRHALADAFEQVEAEIAFEQAQLMADGAAGQVQFVGGAPHAAMTGEAVERTQRLGRWYSQDASGEPNLHEPEKHITF